MNAPYAITTVMVNENLKKVVEPKKRKFKFLSYFFCAAVAGIKLILEAKIKMFYIFSNLKLIIILRFNCIFNHMPNGQYKNKTSNSIN